MPNFSTGDTTMNGIRVTAVFSDGFQETLVWGATAAGVADSTVGGAHHWALSQSGDTFNNPWVLTNSATTANISTIIVSGLGGVNAAGQATIFDRTNSNDTGGTTNEQTLGSHNGHDFSITSGTLNTYQIAVTYSNIFSLAAMNPCVNSGTGSGNERTASPCADEWATFTFHFNTGAGVGNFGPGSTLSFSQDADNVTGGLTAPEPATMTLLMTGLLAGILLRGRTI